MPDVFLSDSANRQFRALDRPLQERIKESLATLKDSSATGKRIHPSRFWSLRCGDYRMIYEVVPPGGRVLVLFVGHWKKVYDELSRFL